MRDVFDQANDFDPRDPMFGLDRHALSGPRLERRTVLRLLAASGALTVAHLLPGTGLVRPAAAAGGTLKAGWSGVGEFRTLDPAQINQVLQFQITSNVLSGLTHVDPKFVAQGDLAMDWSANDDGTEYIFNLRENVTFHNGDKFTADDVIFTYQRSKDPQKSIHSRVIANIADIEKLGDHKIKIKLSAPQASLLVKTLERSSGRAMTIVSRGGLEQLGTEQYGLTPIGTGPFRVTDHKLGQSMTLERFDKYYDPERPKLDKIIIQPIIDPEPLAAAIEAGDIHIIGGNPIAPELADRFEANADLVVSDIPAPGFQSVWLNPYRDPMRVDDFNKPLDELMKEPGFKVRLAIAKAIDRDEYIRQAQFGRGTPGYGTINPAMGFFFDDKLGETSTQKFDLAAAKALLAEAGFPEGKGFPVLKIIHTPSTRRDCQVIKAMLKRNLGIDIDLDTKDFPVLIDQFDTMDWDLVRLGSGGDFDPDDGLIDWMQTASKFNGRKRDKAKFPFGFFSEKEVDALIDQQAITASPEKRKELVQKANRITSDKVASAFLFHPADILVYRKTVNLPAESRIPGLVDMDRITMS
jgi:ABC-type transport system substrate-binding protein